MLEKWKIKIGLFPFQIKNPFFQLSNIPFIPILWKDTGFTTLHFIYH